VLPGPAVELMVVGLIRTLSFCCRREDLYAAAGELAPTRRSLGTSISLLMVRSRWMGSPLRAACSGPR